MASCCQARRYFFDTARRCSSGRMVLLASTGLPFLAAVRSFALPHQPIRSRLYILCTIPDIMPAPGIPMAICIVFLCPAAMLCRHIFFPRCAKLFHFRAPFLLVVVPFLWLYYTLFLRIGQGKNTLFLRILQKIMIYFIELWGWDNPPQLPVLPGTPANLYGGQECLFIVLSSELLQPSPLYFFLIKRA